MNNKLIKLLGGYTEEEMIEESYEKEYQELLMLMLQILTRNDKNGDAYSDTFAISNEGKIVYITWEMRECLQHDQIVNKLRHLFKL